MTTPDDEITGYGGQPKTGPDSTPNTASSNNASSGSSSSHKSSTNQDSSATGHAAEDAKMKAKEAAEQLKAQGKTQLEGYRETAADEIEKVAKSAKAAAQALESEDSFGLSNYVSDMAQHMVQFSDSLRGKSVDELFQDVNRIARNNPALFITGSIALGFGLTRFARASSKRATHGDDGHEDRSSDFSSSTSHRTHGQQDLTDRFHTGQPDTTDSVSNAGVSSATSTSRPTTRPGAGTGTGIGTGSATGVGTGLSSASTGADTRNGLGIGSNPGSSIGSTNSRDGKGTDGGLSHE